MFESQPKRHPMNTKLNCFYNPYYRGFEVNQHAEAPLIENHLERGLLTQNRALNHYTRVLAFRIDLRFPEWMPAIDLTNDNTRLSAFYRHLNEEIAKADTKYSTVIRYVWCREQESSDKPHYHLMVYVNYDAYHQLGRLKPSEGGGYEGRGLYHQFARAWAKALDYLPCDIEGLVHVGKNPITQYPYVACLHRDDFMGQEDAVFNLSYLCKAHSKPFNQGVHVFGTSRI
ncbi:YagK/YfjJ domain-containing protein [Halomonas sp. WWR20]